MKGTFSLQTAEDDSSSLAQLELYLRLSYLGSSVVTEIDKPSSDSFFYAQEETNLGESSRYECRELDTSAAVPTSAVGPPIFSAKLECVCTDEQKYRLLQPEGTMTQATTTTTQEVEGKGEDDGKRKKKGKKVKKRAKDKGTSTEPETADKAVGTKGKRASLETKDKEGEEESALALIVETMNALFHSFQWIEHSFLIDLQRAYFLDIFFSFIFKYRQIFL